MKTFLSSTAKAEMKEKFQKGEWVTRVPQGYDIVQINGVRRIIVNEEGKKLRKAFQWRAKGMKNEEIIQELLKKYSAEPKMAKVIAYQIEHLFEQMNKDGIEQEKASKEKFAEVTKKIDTIEEKYYVLEEMNKESFDQFYAKYSKERMKFKKYFKNLRHRFRT